MVYSFFFETSAPGLPGSTCNLVCNLCVQLVQPKRGCFWLSDPRSCKPSGALRRVRSDALGSHGVSMNFYRCICLLLSTRMTCSNSSYLFGVHYSCPLGFQLFLLTSILEALVSPQNPVKGCFFFPCLLLPALQNMNFRRGQENQFDVTLLIIFRKKRLVVSLGVC